MCRGSCLIVRCTNGHPLRRPAGLVSPTVRKPVFPYFSVALMMGVGLSILGPSVSHLEGKLDVSKSVISILFAVGSVSNFLGAIASSFVMNRVGGHASLRVGLAGIATGVLLLCAGPSFFVVAVGMALAGCFAALCDTGMNTLTVWARAGEAGPALNALHLSFGVGAFMAPLAVDRALVWTDNLWPAALFVIALFALSLTLIGAREEPPHPHADHVVDRPNMPRPVVVIVALFFLLYVGAEVGFGGWIHTYAEDVGMGGSRPAFVTAVFWGAFSLGRLVAIPVSSRVRPFTVVLGACITSVIGLLVLVVGDGAGWAVWLGTAVYGFASGPQYPTMFAMVDARLSLTPSATGTIVAAAGFGAVVFPTAIGPLLDHVGSGAMPLLVFAVSAVAAVWVLNVQRAVSRASAPDRTVAVHPA